MTPCGSFVLKHTSSVILLLWIVHVGVFGETLFGQMYRLDCEDRVLPFAVYSMVLGCLSAGFFVIFRAFAGHFSCQPPVRSLQALITYFFHCGFALLTLVTTGLCYAEIQRSSCNGYDPSPAPFVCVSLINVLNGFISIEQTPCCRATSLWSERDDSLQIIVESPLTYGATSHTD